MQYDKIIPGNVYSVYSFVYGKYIKCRAARKRRDRWGWYAVFESLDPGLGEVTKREKTPSFGDVRPWLPYDGVKVFSVTFGRRRRPCMVDGRDTWDVETFLWPYNPRLTPWENNVAALEEAMRRGHELDQQIKVRLMTDEELRGRAVTVTMQGGESFVGRVIQAITSYAFVDIGGFTGPKVCKYQELCLK